jgi:hypothetical protein
MMPKHFTINYTIYPFDLLVSVCEDDYMLRCILEDKLQSRFHHEIDELFKNLHEGNTICFSNGATVIRFVSKPSQGLIAHEALHAVEMLMENIGNNRVDETWNYLLQYIVNQINKNIKKHEKEKRKSKSIYRNR